MEFMKLSEVPVVENASNAYILVEEGGEIKRLHVQDLEAPQVQADLSEEDPTKASYVHGKENFAPETGSSGSASIVTYRIRCGSLQTNSGSVASMSTIIEEWNNGNAVRLIAENDVDSFNVISIKQQYISGSLDRVNCYYHDGSDVKLISVV